MNSSIRFYTTGKPWADFGNHIPAPLLRCSFPIDGHRKVQLKICAPGYYQLYVNGQKLTKGLLAPYTANPDHLLYYDTYDLSDVVNEGENVIGLILGNGVLNSIGGIVWDLHNVRWRSAPMAAIECHALLGENSVRLFDASDFVWSDSPVIFNDLRAGEWYDATLKQDGWNLPGFDDSTWHKMICVLSPPRGEITENDIDPIVPIREITPIEIRRSCVSIYPEISPLLPVFDLPPEEMGEGWLYDFGINTAGICRLTIRNARPGQKIVLQFGEILGENPKGEINTTVRESDSGLDLRGFHFLPDRYNNRDVYICRGDAVEIWEPSFCYHGFRYCLVFGLDDAQAVPELLTYVVMHTSLTARAGFTCSDETVCRIMEISKNADLSNFHHFPTDCPHREKNGWTGDAYLSAEQMLRTFSCERNFRQWLHNIRKSMRENGDIPGIIPTNSWGYSLGVLWGSIIIEYPYQIWKQRNDRSILSENADAILRFLLYISSQRNRQGIIPHGLGDWCQSARNSVSEPLAPSEFTSTVTALDDCRKAAEIFRELNMTAHENFANTLYRELWEAGRREFLDASGTKTIYRCQSAQALAIWFDLVDEAAKIEAVEILVQYIHDQEDFLDGGILGLRVLFRVLIQFGYAELAWKMITRPEFPSYGYMVKYGATALLELFSPMERGQSSCNHHFRGDILCTIPEMVLGIRYDGGIAPLTPHFMKSLSDASGWLETPAGRIEVAWERDGDDILYTVTLPADCSVRMILPDGWQFERGFTSMWIDGSQQIRILPSNKNNILHVSAEKYL